MTTGVTNRSGVSIGVDLGGGGGSGDWVADSGASTIGRQLVSAATTAAVHNLLEAGTVGLQIYKAVSTAAAQAIIGGADWAVDSGASTVGKQLVSAATTAAVHNLLEAGAAGLNVYKSVTTAAAQNILGFTTPGKNLVNAATTAAQRSALELGDVVTFNIPLPVSAGGTGVSALAANVLLAGGNTVTATPIAVSGNNISNYGAVIQLKNGPHTLVSGDTGTVIVFTSTSAVSLTCPKTMPSGFCVEVIQDGTGQITISAATSAVVRHRQSHTKIAGQYGAVRLFVVGSQSGFDAVYNMVGDTIA